MIGGNITAVIQKKATKKNNIGEAVEAFENIGHVIGWLDFANGQNGVQEYNAKLQDTTHYFICDFDKWQAVAKINDITAGNSRLVINNNIYNILLIDNPMELNDHIEIYLKYIGAGL